VNEANIFLSTFSDLSQNNGRGGAIEKVGSVRLAVKHSFFRRCTAKTSGGAIYNSDGYIAFYRVCFSSCNLVNVVDNNFGNAIYLINSQNEVNESSANLCGQSVSSAADSPFVFWTGTHKAYNHNYTNCHGTGGSAGPNILGAQVGSYCRYINADTATSSHGMIIVTSSFTFSYINLIRITTNSNKQFFYSEGSSSTISNCNFFLNSFSVLQSHSTLVFSNCYSDFTGTSGITKTTFRTCKITIIENGMCLVTPNIPTHSWSYKKNDLIILLEFLILKI